MGITELIKTRQYGLRCPCCLKIYEDFGTQMSCDSPVCEALSPKPLLETTYPDSFSHTDQSGLYKYANWLPMGRYLQSVSMPPTLQLSELNQLLGLPNLWVTLSGFAPEYGAFLETGSFKDIETQVVLSRLSADQKDCLVIASAKNSAASYIRLCSLSNTPCVVIVPDYALLDISQVEKSNCVKVIAIEQGEYSHAILLSQLIGNQPGFQLEGGIYNVGRREGVGAIFLSAIDAIGKMPDWYVQAIGSGTGPIAVLETINRLIPEWELPPVQFLLSQCRSFAPMVMAWESAQSTLALPISMTSNNDSFASVLSTRFPHYNGPQGIYSLLKKTKGQMVAIEALTAKIHQAWFLDTFNIELDTAAAIALASLHAKKDQMDPDSTILLHLTGLKSCLKKEQVSTWTPDLYCSIDDLSSALVLDKIKALCHE